MVRLREIPRTAAFAWSPGASNPLVATGTRAGAVSDDFSTETKLELWNLGLDSQSQGVELQPFASINADSRFYDIAWGLPLDNYPKGIIAGALENGSITLWDADKLVSGSPDALISSTTKHTGAIKSLQFNPLKPQIFVSAGEKGELFVYDVKDIDNPFRLGSSTGRPEDLECVAWNRKVAHILATGSTGGFVHIWDVKNKKSSLSINNRKPVSAIAWDPNNSTKLMTATPDDGEPRIALWNLRNSKEPEKILQGHLQGVLSLSWCDQDADLLLSSGKDAKTIVWNPQTGEKLGELPEVTNWAFSTSFHPHNPNLTATASFDGKITIQTLQNTNPETSDTSALNNMDDADFFSNVQTQPQTTSFSLSKAPKWFERPISASFGFGGKLIVLKGVGESTRKSKIEILPFSVDSEVSHASRKFEDEMKSGDVKAICDEHRESATTDEEKADWLVMGTLVAEDQRNQITEYLGFTKDDAEARMESEGTAKGQDITTEEPSGDKSAKEKRLSNFFDDSGDGDDEFPSAFAVDKDAEPGTPFLLVDSNASSEDQQITQALVLGNFEKATTICLKEKRFSDAFLIANCGPKDLVEKVQTAYLAHQEGSPSYLRVLGSVIRSNLNDVVQNADLSNWKEAMVTICTYATPAEFPGLCESLGDRVFESGSRKDASLCYLVGSKLEKVVSIWISELREAEQEGVKEPNEDSTFSVHARTLQQFIEKVTVFRHVTKFEDTEKSLSSGWKLSALYDKYIEYADIVSSHGLLSVAQVYLDLLPATYPAAELSRNRVKQATLSSTTKPASRQTPASRTAPRTTQPAAYQPSQPTIPGPGASNPYQLSQPQYRNFTPPSANVYQPPAPAGPYAPSQTYAPPQQFGAAGSLGQGPTSVAPPIAGPPMGGPPRNTTPSNPSIKKDAGAWNDVPMVAKPPPARRMTPSVAPMSSPFQGQQNTASPPPMNPYGLTATPPPPPPKGPAPPRMASPAQPIQPPLRPSSAANAYAPPPQSQMQLPPPGPPAMPRVSSPYNASPAVAPPTSRYAPAPAAQQPASQPPMGGPPPGPRPSPYGAAPHPAATQSPYNPSPYNNPQSNAQHPLAPPPSNFSAPPPAGPPMGGPPMGGPAMGGPPRAGPPHAGGATGTPPPPRGMISSPPTATGQIPPEAQRMVDMLSREVKRVANLAPPQFANVVADTEKRLNILFEHLRNDDLVKPDTIVELTQLAEALEARDYDTASNIQVKIQTTKTNECGNWMVGVKRLVSMSKSTA